MNQTSERTTINFIDTVNGEHQKTLVSQHIQRAYKIKRLTATFAPGANRQLYLRFFISLDSTAPTTSQPTGTNILAQHSQQSYIIGDDCTIEFNLDVPYSERSSWIKVHANNDDSYQHSIIAAVEIEFEPEEG